MKNSNSVKQTISNNKNQFKNNMRNLILGLIAVLTLTVGTVNAKEVNPKQKVCNELNSFVRSQGFNFSKVTYEGEMVILKVHSSDISKLQPSFTNVDIDDYIDSSILQSFTAYAIESSFRENTEAVNRFIQAGIKNIKVVLVSRDGKEHGSQIIKI